MTAVVTDMTHRPQELLKRVNLALYEEAYKSGRSLSAHLEAMDPSEGYNDGLDAFSRLLKCANIRTRSIPEFGVYANRFGEFDTDDNTRALVPEWIARQWRRVTLGGQRALISSGDQALNTAMNQYADAAQMRESKKLAPAIPITDLVATTTSIDSDHYRAFYLTDDAAAQRMVRVSEGAEVPRAKLIGGDRTIDLYKYGRALEVTYEALRRMPIDKVSLYIQRLAIQAETDKVATVIDVLVNGDGNSGTAATSYNLTTLDSGATAGTLSLKGWMAFKMKFANPYMMDTALTQEAVALQMFLLNAGSANIPMVSLTGQNGQAAFRPINRGLAEGVALGWTSDAPSLKIVALDSRMAVERVTEVGANIQEIERFVTRQTQALVMTEVEGYAIMDANANKILDVNA
jgi:hypothetical protein